MTEEAFTEDGFSRPGIAASARTTGCCASPARVKEIFKTAKGKYIAPAPIENKLNNDQNIELSCVSGMGQPQPYAQIVLAEDLRGKLDQPGVKERVDTELRQLREDVNKTSRRSRSSRSSSSSPSPGTSRTAS